MVTARGLTLSHGNSRRFWSRRSFVAGGALLEVSVGGARPLSPSGIGARQLASVGARLAALLGAVYFWTAPDDGLRALSLWTAFGFALHVWLPHALKAPFFVLLSVTATGYVLGAGPSGAPVAGVQLALLLGMAALFIVLCHLRASRPLRIGALAALGVALALLRTAGVGPALTGTFWSVLAAVFMFRLFIYAASAIGGGERLEPAHALAYFFMLPTAFFPLCPVVDWPTFRQTYFDAEPLELYERGLRTMLRGAVQMVWYRSTCVHWYVSPDRVSDGASLALHLITTYALYLHVSGLFHWFAGTLQLFGWNLPRTNQDYLLAEGFTDYWRRVNIYWKDFMLTFIFNPVAFRLRWLGTQLAVVVAAAVVFAVTWALHAYQAFWLTGEWALGINDALFWSALGGLVMVGAALQARPAARKPSGATRSTWKAALALGLNRACVFSVLCVLWPLWSAESFRQWLEIWARVDAGFFGIAVPAFLVVALVGARTRRSSARRASAGPRRPIARRHTWVGVVAASTALVALVDFGWRPAAPTQPPSRRLELLPAPSRDRLRAGRHAPDTQSYYERILRGRLLPPAD